jgi:hypothetical protein
MRERGGRGRGRWGHGGNSKQRPLVIFHERGDEYCKVDYERAR